MDQKAVSHRLLTSIGKQYRLWIGCLKWSRLLLNVRLDHARSERKKGPRQKVPGPSFYILMSKTVSVFNAKLTLVFFATVRSDIA